MAATPETRIQTSLLSRKEKKILVWMALRLPKWVNPDLLTWLGLAGACIAGVGYILTNFNVCFLWVSSFGLVLNWFGDSLDGTLARVRNIQRPMYGFFLDHNVDGMTVLIICVGAGFSPLISFSASMLILAGYFLLSIFTYINTFLKNEFKISYGKLGPTEMRLAIIFVNTLFVFLPVDVFQITIRGNTFNLLDIIAVCIALILFALYFGGFVMEKRKYEKMDPPPTVPNHNV